MDEIGACSCSGVGACRWSLSRSKFKYFEFRSAGHRSGQQHNGVPVLRLLWTDLSHKQQKNSPLPVIFSDYASELLWTDIYHPFQRKPNLSTPSLSSMHIPNIPCSITVIMHFSFQRRPYKTSGSAYGKLKQEITRAH